MTAELLKLEMACKNGAIGEIVRDFSVSIVNKNIEQARNIANYMNGHKEGMF